MMARSQTHEGLRRLLEDLRAAEARPESQCSGMRNLLDLYVSDELDGLNVQARHPGVWRHLQTCADCRAEHDSMLDLLLAEAEGRLEALPPRPLVVGRAENSPPWRLVLSPPHAAAQPALVFVFAPAYLHQSLRPAAAATGTRVAETSPAYMTEALLLSYLGDSPAGEMLVQLYGQPSPAVPDHCTLTVIATADPPPATAELTWGELTLEIVLDPDGSGRFPAVPIAALEAAAPDTAMFALRLSA